MSAVLLMLVVKGTVILIAACAAAALLRDASAALRHWVWSLTFAALLLLPAWALVGPKWWVDAPAPVLQAVSATEYVVAPAGAPVTTMPEAPRRFNWTWIWLAGAAAAGLRLAVGWMRVLQLLRTSRPAAWAMAAPPKHVRIRESGDIAIPVTAGVFRPVVLLPVAARAWPPDRLGVALAHELAHVQRRDCLTQLVAGLACALYWFQPLAWLASRQLRKERERACDDAVINLGTKCSEYAAHLLGIAKSIEFKGANTAMVIPFLRSHDLQERLKDLLKPGADRRAVPSKIAAAIAIAALAIVVPLASMSAQAVQASGSIVGSVYDASGAAVPHAAITATGLDTKNKEAAYSGAAGEYAFHRIPAGRYLIEVRARGFKPFQKEVLVGAGADLTLNPTMDVGSVNETIDVVADAPRQQSTAGTPHRIRVGGNVQATKLVYHVNPIYPEHARQTGIQGSVVLQAVIGIDGNLMNVTALSKSADPELVQAALDAVRQWRYEPTLLNGAPVEVVTTVTVNFRLQ